jgi:hypothetical protein
MRRTCRRQDLESTMLTRVDDSFPWVPQWIFQFVFPFKGIDEKPDFVPVAILVGGVAPSAV